MPNPIASPQQSWEPISSPDEVYKTLLLLWALATSVEEPDPMALRYYHKMLCELEAQLCQKLPHQCLKNLLHRLQQAREMDLSLPLPSWAAEESAALFVGNRKKKAE